LATHNNQAGFGYIDIYTWPGLVATATGVAVNASGSTDNMSFSPDGAWLLIIGGSGTAYVYDTSDWSYRTLGYHSTAYSTAWSPDSTEFALTAYTAPRITRYAVDDLTVIASLDSGYAAGAALSVDYAPDGLHLAWGLNASPAYVFIVRLSDMGLAHTATLGGTGPYSIKYSPDGTMVAAGMDNYNVSIIDTSDGTYFNVASPVVGDPYALDWGPDGTRLLVANNSGVATTCVKMYDTSDWSVVPMSLTGHSIVNVRSVRFTADGLNFAVAGSSDGSGTTHGLAVFDASTFALVGSLGALVSYRSIDFNRVGA
jgi:WD40 repeat protein